MEGLSEFIESQKERYETELKEFLRIPSISTAPEHEGDMRKCAEFVRDELASV
jgi:acetylornithine deacetylase/succinyl-diaminopimelate desuccinylase-like protein